VNRSESWDPAWIRWVPLPRVGLPLLLGGFAAVTAASLEFGLPRGLLSLVAIPIPFLATRWSRGPSYAALAGLLAASLTLSLLEGGGVARTEPPRLSRRLF